MKNKKKKKSGALIKIVAVIIIVYAVITLVSLRGRIEDARAGQDELRRQIAALTEENEEKRFAIEHRDDPSVLEDIARNDLDLVYEDEIVFKKN